MERKSVIYGAVLYLVIFFMPRVAWGFSFKTSSITGYLNTNVVPNKLGNIVSGPSDVLSVVANGAPVDFKDKVYIEDVLVNTEITKRGFSVEVRRHSYSYYSNIINTLNRCVWIGPTCAADRTGYFDEATVGLSIRLTRNSNVIYDPIPAGTQIARIKLRQHNKDGPAGSSAYLYYRTKGEIAPVIPTCDVKDFTNNVILPDVKRTDLVSHGAGRYTGVTKEFNINLECESSPKVNVTFDGDKMSGVTSEDVLVNKLPGNDNVGVQILYGSNSLKIGEKVSVLNSAGTNESLKFNAYYYYKGGIVQSGPVKSQTVFTFDYE